MIDISGKSVALIGYGVSNQSLCRYFMDRGIFPTVRGKEKCALPEGISSVFGEGYLDVQEDIAFRSPSVRPDAIKGKRVFTEALFALNKIPAYKIGVTGSDGKTTTSTLIYRMLTAYGKNAFLCGNIGKPVIDICCLIKKEDFAVAELSSFQLIDGDVTLDTAVVTNITENHLDWHKNMEEYILAKRNILKNAKNLVLNYDDKIVRGFGRENCTYVSLKDRSDIVGKKYNFVYVKDGHIFYNLQRLFPVDDICLKGQFNILNIMFAIGCVYSIVGLDVCHRVAKEFCGVGCRQELVKTVKGVKFINSSIDSTPNRTVKTLSAYPLDKTVAILGGYDKNLSYEPLRGTLNSVKAVIICGENRDKISACTTNKRVINVNTLEEAVRLGFSLAKEGDFVILSPASASFDMFKNYKEKADCFIHAVKGLCNGED